MQLYISMDICSMCTLLYMAMLHDMQSKWKGGCRGAQIRVVSPEAVPDDDIVAEGGGMGAPTVSLEKLRSYECEQAVMAVVAAGGAHASSTVPRECTLMHSISCMPSCRSFSICMGQDLSCAASSKTSHRRLFCTWHASGNSLHAIQCQRSTA